LGEGYSRSIAAEEWAQVKNGVTAESARRRSLKTGAAENNPND